MGREGFSACALTDQCPRLTSRVPATQESVLSLWPEEKRGREPQNQSGREEEGVERPCEACVLQPPYPKSGTAGTGSQPPGADSTLRPASSGGKERVLLTIFETNRHALACQEGGAKVYKVRRKKRKGLHVAG